MAPPVDSPTHCERDDNPENCGIEITDEMIEAGADAILGEVGGAPLGANFSTACLAREVFLAIWHQMELDSEPRLSSERRKQFRISLVPAKLDE